MTDDADKMFAQEMLKHHQEAVKMSKAFLQKGSDAKLLFTAKGIIKAQMGEIEFFEEWLKKNKSSK